MKPALIYYGGKQGIINHILPLIPKHDCYCEPFAGGATVFFAKKKSSVEVLNDNLDSLINFYRVLQDPEEQKELYLMCKKTLYSRADHNQALELFKNGNNIEKAWALWFKINTGFSGKMDGGFSTTKSGGSSPAIKFQNYKNSLSKCGKRLEEAQLEKLDAVECIKVYDSNKTFHYVDPPYLDADQGHYKGYSPEDFERLLKELSLIKGMFLLSCYPGSMIDCFIQEEGWYVMEIEKRIRARNPKRFEKQITKTELLVWNYQAQISKQINLFNEVAV